MIFGREPAVVAAVAAALLKLLSLFVFPDFGPDQQAITNAVIVALLGAVVAFQVSAEKGLAALLGLGQAIVALAVGFGLDWSQETQVAVMGAFALVLGLFERKQVVAPVDAAGNKRPANVAARE